MKKIIAILLTFIFTFSFTFAATSPYLPKLGDVLESIFQDEADTGDSYGDADLRISSITYDRDDDRLRVRIYNEGGEEVTKSFRNKVKINGKTYYFNVNKDIEADTSYTASFSINNFRISSSRRYTVSADVDVNNVIDESNESNNDYEKQIYLYENEDEYEDENEDEEDDRADLKITDLKYESGIDRLGVEISNLGDIDVRKDFRIRIKIDDEYYYFHIEDTIYDNDERWEYIDMDQFNIKRGGTYTVSVRVDSDSDIKEYNELNNTYEEEFYLQKNEEYYGDLPDLKVTDIKYDKSDRELEIRVYNKGEERVEDEFRLRVEINNDKEYIDVTSTIYDGGYKWVYIDMDNFSIKTDDEYTVNVDVDVDGDIREENEGNNSYEERIYLYEDGEADLQVTDIRYDSSDDELEIKIYNKGDEDVDEDFLVSIEIDDKIYYVDMIENINDNSYKWLYVDMDEFNIRDSDTYNIKVKADYDDDIEEKSESNNGYSERIYLNKN